MFSVIPTTLTYLYMQVYTPICFWNIWYLNGFTSLWFPSTGACNNMELSLQYEIYRDIKIHD